MISYYMLFGSISMIDNYYKVCINLMKELICELRKIPKINDNRKLEYK